MKASVQKHQPQIIDLCNYDYADTTEVVYKIGQFIKGNSYQLGVMQFSTKAKALEWLDNLRKCYEHDLEVSDTLNAEFHNPEKFKIFKTVTKTVYSMEEE